MLASAGALLGLVIIAASTAVLAPALETRFGIFVELRWPDAIEWIIAGVVVLAGIIVSFWPAWRAYRNALADGLTIRL